MTPFGVEIIAIPRPLLTFGKLSALENILLPGFDILYIVLITWFPELYYKLILRFGFLSSDTL